MSSKTPNKKAPTEETVKAPRQKKNSKPKFDKYQLERIRGLAHSAVSNAPLANMAVAAHLLPESEVSEYKMRYQLNGLLLFEKDPNVLKKELAAVDWNSISNPHQTVFRSGNIEAFKLLPFDFMGNKHSNSTDGFSSYQYASHSLLCTKKVETEWLITNFFSCNDCYSLSSVSPSHHEAWGVGLANKMQNQLWEHFIQQGLTGDTRVESGAFCGIIEPRKVFDVLLVYFNGNNVSYMDKMLSDMTFDNVSDIEETLFALNGMPFRPYKDNNNHKVMSSFLDRLLLKLDTTNVNWERSFYPEPMTHTSLNDALKKLGKRTDLNDEQKQEEMHNLLRLMAITENRPVLENLLGTLLKHTISQLYAHDGVEASHQVLQFQQLLLTQYNQLSVEKQEEMLFGLSDSFQSDMGFETTLDMFKSVFPHTDKDVKNRFVKEYIQHFYKYRNEKDILHNLSVFLKTCKIEPQVLIDLDSAKFLLDHSTKQMMKSDADANQVKKKFQVLFKYVEPSVKGYLLHVFDIKPVQNNSEEVKVWLQQIELEKAVLEAADPKASSRPKRKM